MSENCAQRRSTRSVTGARFREATQRTALPYAIRGWEKIKMGTQGAVAIVQADAHLPGSPFAVVYMVKATAIALETANAGLAPQKA